MRATALPKAVNMYSTKLDNTKRAISLVCLLSYHTHEEHRAAAGRLGCPTPS